MHIMSITRLMLLLKVSVSMICLLVVDVSVAQETPSPLEWEMVSTVKIADLVKKGKPGQKIPVGFMRGKAKSGAARNKREGAYRQGSEEEGPLGVKGVVPSKWRVVSYQEYKMKLDNCFCGQLSSFSPCPDRA